MIGEGKSRENQEKKERANPNRSKRKGGSIRLCRSGFSLSLFLSFSLSFSLSFFFLPTRTRHNFSLSAVHVRFDGTRLSIAHFPGCKLENYFVAGVYSVRADVLLLLFLSWNSRNSACSFLLGQEWEQMMVEPLPRLSNHRGA